MTDSSFALGIQAYRDGRLAEAEHLLRTAIDQNPAEALPAYNLGAILMEQGRYHEAQAPLIKAVERNPAATNHWAALAQAFGACGNHSQAARCLRELTRRMPESAELWRSLGEALYRSAEHAEAEQVLIRAEDLAVSGLGQMLLGHCARGRLDHRRAIGHYRTAIAMLPPETVAARTSHWMMGISMLELGDFDRGWAEMEWRLTVEPLATPHAQWNANLPEWDGTLSPGLRLVVHYEQGLGDTLHFVRYLPILRAHGIHVTLVAQAPLVRLLRRQGAALADLVIDDTTGVPPADAHVWLMSVPDRLRPVLKGDIPTATPYLTADPDAIARARAILRSACDGRPAIGLVWAGNPRHGRDRSRSIPYAALAPLLDQTQARFFSFQMGAARDEFRANPHPNLIDVTEDLNDFDGTAAAMAALDGFITVDSAPAHLAGALKIPAAILVARSHDWRWGAPHLFRSPWYPGAVLYRQAEDMDWAPQLQHLTARLRAGTAFLNQF